MAKAGGKVSKNQSTAARKKLQSTLEGKKVKPLIIMRNPLGRSVNGIKIPSGRFKGVQTENGTPLMSSTGDYEAWDNISKKIIQT